MLSNRAIGTSIMASFLVVAAVCVFNENTLAGSTEIVAEDTSNLRGNALIEAQAKEVDAQRDAENAGRNMKSVDDMLSNFATEEDPAFTDKLEKNALKKDEWDVSIAPDASGNIPHIQDKTVDDLDTYDEDTFFFQTASDDTEWSPKGQGGLSGNIAKAKAEEEAAEDHTDGLDRGDTLLSVAGLGKHETEQDFSDEMALFQSPATTPTVAQDQITVSKIPKARNFDSDHFEEENQYDSRHYKAPEDDDMFDGNGILSAVGIKDAAGSETEMLGTVSADDFDFSFKPEDSK